MVVIKGAQKLKISIIYKTTSKYTITSSKDLNYFTFYEKVNYFLLNKIKKIKFYYIENQVKIKKSLILYKYKIFFKSLRLFVINLKVSFKCFFS